MTLTCRALRVSAALLASLGVAVGAQAPGPDFLRKPSLSAIRMMTWNVGADSVFAPAGTPADRGGTDRPAQFARVLRALQPDVICLQEVTVSVERVAREIDDILPLPDGRRWQAHHVVDTVVLYHGPITMRGGAVIDAGARNRGHSVALLDLSASGVPAVHVTCAHFQSSSGPADIAARQRQAAEVVNALHAAKQGRGPITLAPRTPFVVLGDINAIATDTVFLQTLLTGRIPGTATSDGGIDWDDTPLTDALPAHNGTGADVYTWRHDLEPYPPGILDRVLYSDSVLDAVNRFVLNTLTLAPEVLRPTGMRAIDVMRDPAAGIHDHFPVVVDFVVRAATTP